MASQRAPGLLLLSSLCIALLSSVAEGQTAGVHYYVIENVDRGTVKRRGTAGTLGVAFSNLILAPRTHYRAWLLSAETLRVGRLDFETGPPGSALELPAIQMLRANSLDADRDGLPDVGESIAGTFPRNPDSDGDGISDGAELQQGTNPLDGLAVIVGVLSTLALPGEAVDVCVSEELLVIAHTTGVTGLNIFTGLEPKVIFRVDTTGAATRVACSAGRVLLVVEGEGMAIFDATDPTTAHIAHQISSVLLGGVPRAVTAAGGIGYAGTDTGRVLAVDLATGLVVGTTGVGDEIADLALAGKYLYAVAGNRLHAVVPDPGALAATDSVSSTVAGGFLRVAAGGGLAYGVHDFGYNTFDLSDPAHPTHIASGSTVQTWLDLAVNGSGLGVAALRQGAGGDSDANLYDVSDPTITNEFLGTVETPGDALAIEIANGRAYVADSANGLTIVNYLAFDGFGIAPSIGITTHFDAAGVEERTRLLVEAAVTDDVQVRSVEFVVDGVSTVDAGFPFEHRFVAPALAEQDTFTLRARAFDTGGNFTWTDPVIVALEPDSSPPLLLGGVPRGGVVAPVEVVAAFVSEPLDSATVTSESFTLLFAGPDRRAGTADDSDVAARSVEFRADIRAAYMTVTSLSAGLHQGRLAATVTGAAGNPLAGDFYWYFTDYETTDVDGDGELDGLEDGDGDGLINAYEIVLGLDPERDDFDLLQDGDEDGVTDLDELVLGSDPAAVDSDGDGYSDGDEVLVGTDPIDPVRIPISTAFDIIVLENRAAPRGAAYARVAARNLTAPQSVLGEAGPQVLGVDNTASP